MVIGNFQSPRNFRRGSLITEMAVAMAFLVAAILPLLSMAWALEIRFLIFLRGAEPYWSI
mgnify:CR=1 FL=1